MDKNKVYNFNYPHGFKKLVHPHVLVTGIVFAALVIIPVSINFELGKASLIFVLFLALAIFSAIVAMLPPRVYLFTRDGVVVYNTSQFSGKSEVSFSLDEIDKVEVISESQYILYVIPVVTEEVGLYLLSRNGDEFLIRKDNFHRVEDYNLIKKFIKESV
ncbi:MAG: hypothetical protein AB1403_13795 [Candidatus Riflebacteria bacterium]